MWCVWTHEGREMVAEYVFVCDLLGAWLCDSLSLLCASRPSRVAAAEERRGNVFLMDVCESACEGRGAVAADDSR